MCTATQDGVSLEWWYYQLGHPKSALTAVVDYCRQVDVAEEPGWQDAAHQHNQGVGTSWGMLLPGAMLC
jgi:hypothetical protein